ncbi:hypothetical protein EYF80_053420 [Liparis tanakae]|uniref:Uncharacterized protein n=1 Tax=Liparis tanakae TaxID=230148 RepID=A0A4Z2F6F0_9TELE|nr:hypothetical protein EYF80_053420 [Liparis tanakae]
MEYLALFVLDMDVWKQGGISRCHVASDELSQNEGLRVEVGGETLRSSVPASRRTSSTAAIEKLPEEVRRGHKTKQDRAVFPERTTLLVPDRHFSTNIGWVPVTPCQKQFVCGRQMRVDMSRADGIPGGGLRI